MPTPTRLLLFVLLALPLRARADLPTTPQEFEVCVEGERCKSACMEDAKCRVRLQKWLGGEMERLQTESAELDRKAAEVSKSDPSPPEKAEPAPPAKAEPDPPAPPPDSPTKSSCPKGNHQVDCLNGGKGGCWPDDSKTEPAC